MATPVTVTATIQAPSSTALTGNAFVRFRLRNFQGYVPVVTATGVLCETQIDASPDGSGFVSQLLWPNNAITPSNTFWTVEFWNNGRPTSAGNYLIGGNTDLTQAGQLNPPPITALFSSLPTPISMTFSSTPIFDGSKGNVFEMTLTGNVTGSTTINLIAGTLYTFILIQDGTGGRTFAWPSGMKGTMLIDPTAYSTNVQQFVYDGNNLLAMGAGVSV